MPKHAGADGACPDYGSTLDPCPSRCASGVCAYASRPQAGDMHEPTPYRFPLDWDDETHLHPFID